MIERKIDFHVAYIFYTYKQLGLPKNSIYEKSTNF